MTGSNLICIGIGACTEATTQSCAVALGAVQLPPRDHVLAVEGRPVRELWYIGPTVREQIARVVRPPRPRSSARRRCCR